MTLPQWQVGTHTLNQEDGWIRLHTYKEGLLSRMGHDLVIEARTFMVRCELQEEGSHPVEVEIDRAGLFVVEPHDLSDKDRAEIQRNIQKHLPDTPTFTGTFQLQGTKGTLHGQISVGMGPSSFSSSFAFDDHLAQGKVQLSHQALQLKPFRAPLGLIRLQDRLDLSFCLDLTSFFRSSDA